MAHRNENMLRYFINRIKPTHANDNHSPRMQRVLGLETDEEGMPQDPEVAKQIQQAYLRKLREKGLSIDKDGGISR